MTDRERSSQRRRTIKYRPANEFILACLSLFLILAMIPTIVIYRTDLAFSYTDDAIVEIRQNRVMPLKTNSLTTVSEEGDDGGIAPSNGAPRNEDIYKKLSKSSEFAAKADVLAKVYAMFEKEYNPAQCIGIMANVHAEGTIGLVQYGHDAGFGYSTAANPVRMSKPSDLKGFATHVASGESNTGIGICQWTSNGRKAILLQQYQKYCKGESFTEDMLVQAELSTCDYELHHGYSLVNSDDPATCAYSFCADYEKPYNTIGQAVHRAGIAKRMADILL